MTTVGITHPREPVAGKWWWVFLVTGILWILIGLFVLNAHYDSAVVIGYMVELLADLRRRRGIHRNRRWRRVGGGSRGAWRPVRGRWSDGADVAVPNVHDARRRWSAILLVIKGTFDFVIAIMVRESVDLWWLTMIAGIFEIMLGIWAAGYPGRSAALLIIWIGIGAMIRGIRRDNDGLPSQASCPRR